MREMAGPYVASSAVVYNLVKQIIYVYVCLYAEEVSWRNTTEGRSRKLAQNTEIMCVIRNISNDTGDSPGSSKCKLSFRSKGSIDPQQQIPLTESSAFLIDLNLNPCQEANNRL